MVALATPSITAFALETARTIAVVGTIGFVVLAIAAGILMKSIAQKLALVAIFGLLALLVWTQRTSLDECADVLRQSISVPDDGATCTFFGRDVTIRASEPS